ncbi:MAG TPA: c-type cytochrome [Galbitalea sp.]|jgi:ubiquinol-cytochrome c reductase cytochrome c subunit|nr:c-type cytochrome [Galbitalea sp.]
MRKPTPSQTNPAAPARTGVRRRKAGRRSPLVSVALILIGLVATGGAYALFTTSATASTTSSSTQLTTEGKKLFQANCATCHGMNLEGTKVAPSLAGVGAAAVDFQVSTGRMPAAASGPQEVEKPVQFTTQQIQALYTYVASVAKGPGIPSTEYTGGNANSAKGAQLFRTNCAMCHNVAGAGGALTEGKSAPSLNDVPGRIAYEAMETGPGNMPVFNDSNLTPTQKSQVISYLKYLDDNPSPGGLDLGNLGPVSEGLFVWIFGLGAIVGVTIWLTAKAN